MPVEKPLLNLNTELEIVLDTAVSLADPEISMPVLAERIYDSEPDLMLRLARPWIIGRITRLLYQKRQRLPAENQLTLPGIPRLPVRMTLKDGRRPYLGQGTIKDLREFRAVLAKQKGHRLRAVEALIKLMEPYAKKNPKVTVDYVLNREHAKQA